MSVSSAPVMVRGAGPGLRTDTTYSSQYAAFFHDPGPW